MFPALGTCSFSLPHPFLKTLQAEVVPTWSSDRAVRKLHTEGAFHILTKNGQNFIIILRLLLLILAILTRLTTHQLLSPPRLLLLRQRHIHLNRPDSGDQLSGGTVHRRSRRFRGGGCVGAVRTFPFDGGSHGFGSDSEAIDMPWRDARLADELLPLRWLSVA